MASRKHTWLAPVVVRAGAEAAVAMAVVAMVLVLVMAQGREGATSLHVGQL